VESDVDVATGKLREQVRVSLILGRNWLAAPLKPRPEPVELIGRADQADAHGARSVWGQQIRGPIARDAEAAVDVAVPAAELEFELIENLSFHDAPSP
jgi:hypothetical protein